MQGKGVESGGGGTYIQQGITHVTKSLCSCQLNLFHHVKSSLHTLHQITNGLVIASRCLRNKAGSAMSGPNMKNHNIPVKPCGLSVVINSLFIWDIIMLKGMYIFLGITILFLKMPLFCCGKCRL